MGLGPSWLAGLPHCPLRLCKAANHPQEGTRLHLAALIYWRSLVIYRAAQTESSSIWFSQIWDTARGVSNVYENEQRQEMSGMFTRMNTAPAWLAQLTVSLLYLSSGAQTQQTDLTADLTAHLTTDLGTVDKILGYLLRLWALASPQFVAINIFPW